MNSIKSKQLRELARLAGPKDPTLHRKLKELYLKLPQHKRASLMKLLKEHPPNQQVAANVFLMMMQQAVVSLSSERKRPLHGAKKKRRWELYLR
jgi:hypothetical protein